MKTEYSTAGGSLILEGSRTLKNVSFESISTKKRFFILYLGNLFVTLQSEMCPVVCCGRGW